MKTQSFLLIYYKITFKITITTAKTDKTIDAIAFFLFLVLSPIIPKYIHKRIGKTYTPLGLINDNNTSKIEIQKAISTIIVFLLLFDIFTIFLTLYIKLIVYYR